MSQRMLLSEEDLYEMLSFLVTSAHLCVEEPRLYGTFRMIDAATRLIDYALEGRQLKEDQFLRGFKEDADKGKRLMMTDEQNYVGFLEDATRTLAKEMKRRATAGKSGLL